MKQNKEMDAEQKTHTRVCVFCYTVYMKVTDKGIKKIAHALALFAVFIAFLVIVIPSGVATRLSPRDVSSQELQKRFPGYPTQMFDINGEEIMFIAAHTPERRTKGLSGQEFLGENEAMIFVFDNPGQYDFWMKDMNFAIDMAWLDSRGIITFIQENVQPESYPLLFGPDRSDTLYVLEFAAGRIDDLNLLVGLRIDF
jgi:uncharacterized membrane protein (UPF0127 family)